MENFPKKCDSLDIRQAKALMESKEVTVIDIRDPDSYNLGHIAGAVLVNDASIEQFFAQTDKKLPLICYCYHGISSQSAIQYFQKQGFSEAYSIDGGFQAWEQEFGNTQ